jgi:hypothetical protein
MARPTGINRADAMIIPIPIYRLESGVEIA